MVRFVRRRLVAKVFVPTVLSIVVGTAAIGAYNCQAAQETLDAQHERAASGMSGAIAAGVRHAMLEGNGVAVRELLDDARRSTPRASVRVFDPDGAQVFGEPPPAPDPDSLSGPLRQALASPEPVVDRDDLLHPIRHRETCTECHEDAAVRGVLRLSTLAAPQPLRAGAEGRAVIGSLVESAFVQVMTADQEERMADYFGSLSETVPGVSSVAVYGRDYVEWFGNEQLEVEPAQLRDVLRDGEDREVTVDGHDVLLVPLENEPRCQGCHSPGSRPRGVLAVAFSPDASVDSEAFTKTIDVSLEHIMVAGLGRLVVRFLEDAADTGTVSALSLYDPEGRIYHDAFAEEPPPVHIQRAIDSQSSVVEARSGDGNRFVYVEPLVNEERCQQCHGTDRDLRGAVEVTLDTGDELARSRRILMLQASGSGLLTAGLVLLVLFLMLTLMVVRPVRELGEVADRIGEGDLAALAPVRSGDEIGRLGERLNEMVGGLRQRVALTKMVSQAALDSVEASGRMSVERTGVRKRMVVLFSDIRGFTAYSEHHSPEEVVAMLNDYLSVQAEVVRQHGGDIDKFVGDELVARFDGDGAERRAIVAATEMVAVVRALSQERDAQIAVGVGVNAGEMILGAVGHADRVDFTVIGDAVNLGARLCSAAGRDQVLVSADTVEAAGDIPGVQFDVLEPIVVKGKREPISIVEAKSTPRDST